MTWQLEQSATRLDIQHALLRWLHARCQDQPYRDLYRKAVKRYLSSEGKELLLVGFYQRLLASGKPKKVSNAYSVLRQAESATFKVRSSLPDCNEVFGWADYTVFDLESHSFAWLGIDDGSDSYYVRRSADEYWHRAQGGWSQVTSGRYADAMPGWHSELTDPYTMIEDVLRYAYWADARQDQEEGST